MKMTYATKYRAMIKANEIQTECMDCRKMWTSRPAGFIQVDEMSFDDFSAGFCKQCADEAQAADDEARENGWWNARDLEDERVMG